MGKKEERVRETYEVTIAFLFTLLLEEEEEAAGLCFEDVPGSERDPLKVVEGSREEEGREETE